MKALGVEVVRLSPQSRHMERVVNAFRGVIDGALTAEEGRTGLEGLTRGAPSNGFWYGKAGMVWQVTL